MVGFRTERSTDFGQLDAQNVDLAKLLVMEFALVYGNDWFSVPIPAAIGSLASISTLVVTDTFGVRTLISSLGTNGRHSRRIALVHVQLSGNGARSNFIMLAPTLGLVQDAVALEEVMFLRDKNWRRWLGPSSNNSKVISIVP